MHVIALHVLPSIYLEWFPVTKNYYGQLNQYQYYSLAYNFFPFQYRKPPPPKNRARASRVPRALKSVEPNASPDVFQVRVFTF